MSDFKKKQKVLVVGANGFIGSRLCVHLASSGCAVFQACRRVERAGASHFIKFGNFDGCTPWATLMPRVDVVISTVSRVPKHGLDQVSLNSYNAINLEGTLNLAQKSIEKGVKRFIYLSSIKVNGEFTEKKEGFSADDKPQPIEAYGQSKYQTETALRALVSGTDMELVIIRMPLVYGPGVKGNFLQLLKWVYKGYPLPFKWLHAKRSMVALDNVVSLIDACIAHPNAPKQVLLLADQEPLSISDLLARMAQMMGKHSRVFPFPPILLAWLLRCLGQSGISNRFCRPLLVDASDLEVLLDWSPAVSVNTALQQTVDWFLACQVKRSSADQPCREEQAS